MRGLVDHQSLVVERFDDFDKDKKKRRRNRRPKPNSSSFSACSLTSELHEEGSSCLVNGGGSIDLSPSVSHSPLKHYSVGVNSTSDNGTPKTSNVDIISFPTLRVTDQVDSMEARIMQNEQLDISEDGRELISKSCPFPNSWDDTIDKSFSNRNSIPSPQNGIDQRNFFTSHWSNEVTNEALEKGDAFRAFFCVNAHNRLEAYCKIDGVPIDVLINGIPAQNRAVEGDIVAVEVYHVSLWTQMKGSAGRSTNSASVDDPVLLVEKNEIVGDGCKGKTKVNTDYEELHNGQCMVSGSSGYKHVNEHFSCISKHVHGASFSEQHNEVLDAVGKLCANLTSFPWKRPTGRIVSIIERSARRDVVIGFLGIKQWLYYREACKTDTKRNKSSPPLSASEYVQLTPNDPKYPKMMVPTRNMPDGIKKRMEDGDATVEMELVAAQIDGWGEESHIPQAHVTHAFGRGGEVEPRIAAILFENSIRTCEFPPKLISCLPRVPWEIPMEELKSRRDLRSLCIFTIDPSTATDLDDALSVTLLSNGIVRVGVHIADVSHFVLPDSDLDVEAKIRSTSVYLLQRKLPMLPPVLSEYICSLIPGVDRLAFSMFWDINVEGNVIDRWIGRTIIRSCCKLSYEHAQDIIDGRFEMDSVNSQGEEYPQLHGQYEWPDVIRCVKSLHRTSTILKEKRFNNGALRLESSKVVFLFDEYGSVNDAILCRSKDSNFLVEEFMLLANRTAAEVISRAFPENALLRKHPKPDLRRLGDLEAFYRKHGFEVDTTCSAHLHQSLEFIKQELKNDSALFDVLISYAIKPLKLATYFSSGELKGSESDWEGHYALAVPLYTHFSSPLRRYPDIIVHRTLAAVIEAEEVYMKTKKTLQNESEEGCGKRCFTGLSFDTHASKSEEGREILKVAAIKHGVPSTEILADVAAYSNKRMWATRQVKDACHTLYMWALLKKKQIVFSEARVLGLGPRFMSIYIHKFAIERRINYDDVEGLRVEWLDSTSTLLINLSTHKSSYRRTQAGKFKVLEEVAFVLSPCDLKSDIGVTGNDPMECSTSQVGDLDMALNGPEFISKSDSSECKVDPAVFPLTVCLFAKIPVVLHAVGGDDGPLDVGARLYMSSYFR